MADDRTAAEPETIAADAGETTQFPCAQCGGLLTFDPNSVSLKCPYCGHENALDDSPNRVDELDFEAGLSASAEAPETIEATTVRCASCGAEFTPGPKAQAESCPFCGHPVVLAGQAHDLLKPGGVLPFAFDAKTAREHFRGWLKKLWFAPNDLKRFASADDAFSGMYVPYWTYDCATHSRYRGFRGTNYTVSVPYTTRVQGRTVTRMRTVTRIRWTPASGAVARDFDDVLILASDKLPAKYTERLEPWDLGELRGYDPGYLSGFRAERYAVNVAGGFGRAKQVMDGVIRGDVRRDIGGHHQRITHLATRHDRITYKHLLLPVWLAAYRYGGRPFRIVINGRTGEVQGERPWSWIKIGLTIAAALAVAALLYVLFTQT